MHKVRWPARSEAEHIENLRVLQFTFAQLGETKVRVVSLSPPLDAMRVFFLTISSSCARAHQQRIEINVLVKNKFQDNLQFLHWLHAQWVAAGCPQPTVDPAQRRMRCKGMWFHALCGDV